jgi:hypothetical protein
MKIGLRIRVDKNTKEVVAVFIDGRIKKRIKIV